MNHRSNHAGLTLLEVMISAVILVLVLGISMSTFLRTETTVGESMTITDAALRANAFESILRDQLRSAGNHGNPSQAAPPRNPNGDPTQITFTPVTGFNAAVTPPVTLFGPVRQIVFVYDTGEGGAGSGDDVDNDGDGLIDEGRVELQDAGGAAIAVLAKDISGDDFSIANNATAGAVQAPAGTIQVRYTLLNRMPKNRTVHRETRKWTMAIRN